MSFEENHEAVHATAFAHFDHAVVDVGLDYDILKQAFSKGVSIGVASAVRTSSRDDDLHWPRPYDGI